MASCSPFSSENPDNNTEINTWILVKEAENDNQLKLYIKSLIKTYSYQTNNKINCDVCCNLTPITHKMHQQYRRCSNEECLFKIKINRFFFI